MFIYGVNYAWSQGNFARDFGGVAAWGGGGVKQNKPQRLAELQDMKDHGVSVVRWWVFPALWGDGVAKADDGTPLGLTDRAVEDLEAALDIARQVDILIQPTLFSFDNFGKDKDIGPYVKHFSMAPLLADSERRALLINNVVLPFVRAVSASPNADRVMSWDVINEPEWALMDIDPYSDPAFDPHPALDCVAFADMEAFVQKAVAVIRHEHPAPVTVGGAAVKWAKAWSNCDLDFYTFHLYDWVNEHYPHDRTPASYGITDKPAVIGEFPLRGLRDVPYETLVTNLHVNGWAGAMGWAVTDGPWQEAKHDVRALAGLHRNVQK